MRKGKIIISATDKGYGFFPKNYFARTRHFSGWK
jgi:hypothetical protein